VQCVVFQYIGNAKLSHRRYRLRYLKAADEFHEFDDWTLRNHVYSSAHGNFAISCLTWRGHPVASDWRLADDEGNSVRALRAHDGGSSKPGSEQTPTKNCKFGWRHEREAIVS
jgi:hypothetical protein